MFSSWFPVSQNQQSNTNIPFSFRAISEVHRVADVLAGNRPFEHEVFDAKRMVQPDLFRLEMRG